MEKGKKKTASRADPSVKQKVPKLLTSELVAVDQLHPHKQNYREHPDDQLAHLTQSLSDHGVYRNIVIAKDGTILAGHGVYKAALKLGLEEIPVIRLNLKPDDPKAIKVLVGDNEIQQLAEQNDQLLARLLTQLKAQTNDILGTGYSEKALADLQKWTDALAQDQERAPGLTPEQTLYIFGNNTIKQIVLYFPTEQYVQVIARLKELTSALELETHSDIFLYLLKFYDENIARSKA